MSRASEYAGPGADPAFVRWLDKVDEQVAIIAGLSVFDLPDVDFYGAFDAGESPLYAAVEALAEDGYPGADD